MVFSHLLPFPSPFYFSPLFPHREVTHPVSGFGGTLLAFAARRTKYVATRYITRALNTPEYVYGRDPVRNAFLCIQRPRNVSGGCKCRPDSVKRNPKD